MKTGWHKYLIYFSLIFLVVALYKAHYLEIPRIHSPASLFIATVCLLGGFVVNAIAQQRLLRKTKFYISIRQAIAMTGLNVFGKYIPGKIWMVMGKAIYVAEKNKYPIADLSLLFLHAQIIGLWCGLVLGIYGLVANDALHFLSWVGIMVLGLFTLVLFSKTAQSVALKAVNKVFRKDYSLPSIGITKTLLLVPWFLGAWLLWGCGFFFLAASISDHVFPLSTIFCFPLAGTVGILFLFTPGGIGIRESIITAYLVLQNVPLPEAITIATVSRLWFLSGEFLIFGTGYLADLDDVPSSTVSKPIIKPK